MNDPLRIPKPIVKHPTDRANAPGDALTMWVITYDPKARPPVYRAHKWVCGQGEHDMKATAGTIEMLDLSMLRHDLVNNCGMSVSLGRDPNDDPAIVETWV